MSQNLSEADQNTIA